MSALGARCPRKKECPTWLGRGLSSKGLPPCPVHPWMYVSREIEVEMCGRMKEFRTVLGGTRVGREWK